MNSEKEKGRYMDGEQTREFLGGWTKSRYYKAIGKKQIPFIRLSPKKVMHDREALEKWLAERAVAPVQTPPKADVNGDDQ
jgi:hypothetical protein